MMDNAPVSRKRNGARPKWLLLAVDGAGRDWLFRTSDETVFVIDEAAIIKRFPLAADKSPEALVARIADQEGITRRHLAGSMAAAITQGLDA